MGLSYLDSRVWIAAGIPAGRVVQTRSALCSRLNHQNPLRKWNGLQGTKDREGLFSRDNWHWRLGSEEFVLRTSLVCNKQKTRLLLCNWFWQSKPARTLWLILSGRGLLITFQYAKMMFIEDNWSWIKGLRSSMASTWLMKKTEIFILSTYWAFIQRPDFSTHCSGGGVVSKGSRCGTEEIQRTWFIHEPQLH